MNDAVLKGQVAGTHYLNLGIQPFEFAMKNRWDSAAFSILKYLTRHRNKNGLEDLKKARHIVEIRQQFVDFTNQPRILISMQQYLDANSIEGSDAFALRVLENWVVRRSLSVSAMLEMVDVLIAEIETGVRNDSFYSTHELGV